MTTVEAFHSADSGSSGPATLRLVDQADLPALAILEKEIFGDLAYDTALLRTFYSLFRLTWCVADLSDDLAGHALVGVSSDSSDGWLLGLGVSGRYRGRGLGGKLMDRALASMMEYGVVDAYLTVRPDNNAARRMYHAFGFTQLGAESDYYGNGEPRAVLHRSLTMDPYSPSL